MPFEYLSTNQMIMTNYNRKAKVNENVSVNFNQSQEIAYWAKKYNVNPDLFKKTFEKCGYSISKTLAACAKAA